MVLWTGMVQPFSCSWETTYLGNQGCSSVDRQAAKGTTVSSLHSRLPRATIWMTFQPELGMSRCKTLITTSRGPVDLLCVLKTWFQKSFGFPWGGRLLNANVDFMACVWRLPGCLCCQGAAGKTSRAKQSASSANLCLCLPFNSQISSA